MAELFFEKMKIRLDFFDVKYEYVLVVVCVTFYYFPTKPAHFWRAAAVRGHKLTNTKIENVIVAYLYA